MIVERNCNKDAGTLQPEGDLGGEVTCTLCRGSTTKGRDCDAEVWMILALIEAFGIYSPVRKA